ncbi:MAG: hypothetical protein LBE91_04590 [Tannerella sp.]|jgi:ribose/xylose/arabinose/galactoside ABC-type transport system permease subunit|nr:hypothetical protein [Tannerella sp.]
MIKKSIPIWLSIIPLAILNGGLRETVLLLRLEESCAQIVSGLILLSLILFHELEKAGRKRSEKEKCIIFAV